MTKTVVGLFDNFAEAQEVVQELIDNNFRREDISVVANDQTRAANRDRAVGRRDQGNEAAEGAGAGAVGGTVVGGAIGLLVGAGLLAIPGIGPVLAAGPLAATVGTAAATAGAGALGAGIGAATGGIIGGLVGAGVPREQAETYAEGVRRGGTLVAVSTDDAGAGRAAKIMDHHNVVDIDRRRSEWQQSGWKGFDPNAEPYRHDDRREARTTERREARAGETVMPVVEEEVDIDKRRVERGGVRVDTHVEERPVDKDVRLREERVNVERRAADRPASDRDREAFKEGSFEMRESHEEPVVRKRARVVEEVVIDRDVDTHTEKVHDTARRTDVDVSKTGAGRADTNAYDRDYNDHFRKTYGDTGYSYDDYRPVYNYGAQLATSERYRGRSWSDIEPEARRGWEERNPNTWDQFKDTIRYARERAMSRR